MARTAFTATNIQDGFGNKLAAGTLEILPTDDNDTPITATAEGAIMVAPAPVEVTAGAIPGSLTVADTRSTLPANISYRVTVRDPTGLPLYVLPGVQSPQDGSAINLDTWSPYTPKQATTTIGPVGPAGPAGPAGVAGISNPRGPYASGTTYAKGDLVSEGGSSYLSLQNANTGNDPATSSAWWMLASAQGTAGSASAISALASAISPSFVGRNLFDITLITSGHHVKGADGTLATDINVNATALIYCPGATSMVSNLPIDVGITSGDAICLYDANGNFLSALPNSGLPLAPYSVPAVAHAAPFALPGTQTYVRFGYVPSWFNGYDGDQWPEASDAVGMVYATVTGTATLPGTFQPAGLDTVADVNAKVATVAANAAASLSSAIALALNTVLPAPGISSGNLFDPSRSLVTPHNLQTNGTLATATTGGGTAIATIYCPQATQFITNIPMRGQPNGFGICLYDANGNFIEDISTSLAYTGAWVTANAVQSLPGTQTYLRFEYSTGDIVLSPWETMLFAGTTAKPVPTSLPSASPALGGMVPSPRIKTASQLGCVSIVDVISGAYSSYLSAPFDNAPLLNAFLATASETNPVKLILDGPLSVSGLVISPNGYTTIEGVGPGSGLYMISGSNADAIRIGAYTSSTGSSEAPGGGSAPTRSAQNIALRNFTVNMNQYGNVTGGGSATAANAPVSGAPAHTIFGTILAGCTNVWIEDMNYINAPWFNVCVSNSANIFVRGCKFISTSIGQDGVHVDGKCEDVHISDCYFKTGDDAIALNAPEGYGGDISRVTVTNCIFDGSLTVMRIYTSISPAAAHKVRNVVVSNCTGTTVVQCFNLGITDGESATTGIDQLQDLSVSNCTLSSPYGLAYLLTPSGSISFRDVKFIPTSTSPVVSALFPSVGELQLRGVRVLRNPDGNSAPASLVYIYSGATVDRVAISDFAVTDEEGSSYTALPCLLDCQGTVADVRLEAIDLRHVTALVSGSGWTGVTALRGGGVVTTGVQVPDSVMADFTWYNSSTSGALSIKLPSAMSGTVNIVNG